MDESDNFCSRCGMKLHDEEDASIDRSVRRTREAIAEQCAEHARQRFVLVGEIRRMRGITHPSVRQVRGRDLAPGMMVSTKSPSTWGEGDMRRWDVVIESENDCGYVHILGIDRRDGRSSFCASIGGGDEIYFVDDLSTDMRLERG